MALRMRTNTTTNIQRNQENLLLKKKDTQLLKQNQAPQKRIALGNRTNTTHNITGQKEKALTKESTKIPVLSTKKPNATISISKPKAKPAPVKVKPSEVNTLCSKHNEVTSRCRLCVEITRFDAVKTGREHLSVENVTDRCNAQLCSQYSDDLHKYMRLLEVKYPIRARYLDEVQAGASGSEVVKPRMRQILVNWMLQVAARFELMAETTYLAIAILDRYLQDNVVSRKQLQLVGGTSLVLACKYEELMCPEVNDFVFISDNAYTHADVIRMEMKMLRALDYSLGRPVPLNFLRRLTKVAQYTEPEHHVMGKYLMELTLVDYELCHCRPSLLAAAATHLAQKLITHRDSKWTDVFAYNSGYNEEEILPCMKRLAYLVVTAKDNKYLKYVHEKYSLRKNQSVSAHASITGHGSGVGLLKELAATHLHNQIHVKATPPTATAASATTKSTASKPSTSTGNTTSVLKLSANRKH